MISTGSAFREIKETALFPSVGMKRPHAHLVANFGQRPFVFDIDTYTEVSGAERNIKYSANCKQRRKQEVQEQVDSSDISTLHATLDRDHLTKALVAQYLSPDGYALKGSPESPINGFLAVEEDLDAANRQRKSPWNFYEVANITHQAQK